MPEGGVLKALILGDVVGSPGRAALKDFVPRARRDGAGFVVANGENSAGGSGLTPSTVAEMLAAGVDVITAGDHVFKNKEVNTVLGAERRLLRPANFPDGVPGRGFDVFDGGGARVAVVSLLGRTFMEAVDCPFRKAEAILAELRDKAKIIIVDFHAEATSEKIALARFLDGRVSVVAGTHTHVQTADEQIFPKGTAFITDIGMTGPFESVLGRDIEAAVRKFRTRMPQRLDVAKGDVRASGVLVEIDAATGRAVSIKRVCEKTGGSA